MGLKTPPWLIFLLLFVTILMQAAVNTINDYYDFVKGTDKEENSDDPGDAVLVYNNLKPRHVLILGIAFLGAAACMGVAVYFYSGYVALIVGAIGGAVIVGYSAGPLPFSKLPIGEVVSGFVMGGLIPLGVYASFSGSLSVEIVLVTLAASVPFMIGIGMVMYTNNISDIERDAATNRKTLPVLLKRNRAEVLYRAGIWIWVAATAALGIWLYRFFALILLAGYAAAMPFILPMMKAGFTPDKRETSMKRILFANLFVNGGYVLALAVKTAAHSPVF